MVADTTALFNLFNFFITCGPSCSVILLQPKVMNMSALIKVITDYIFSETNQGLIMSKGGAPLLADTASKTDDSQTLRMVAGAIANLCGNGKRSCF